MLNDILLGLWFFIPAGTANVLPIFAAKAPYIKKFNTPIDNYQSFRGIRILGNHKTIRGFIIGILGAICVAHLQNWYYQENTWLQNNITINYQAISITLLGLLLGSGALIGDAVKSFFKRQKQIPSGQTWFPMDQIDYILGGLLFSSLLITLTLSQYLIITTLWFIIHLISSLTGYLLNLKDAPI